MASSFQCKNRCIAHRRLDFFGALILEDQRLVSLVEQGYDFGNVRNPKGFCIFPDPLLVLIPALDIERLIGIDSAVFYSIIVPDRHRNRSCTKLFSRQFMFTPLFMGRVLSCVCHGWHTRLDTSSAEGFEIP